MFSNLPKILVFTCFAFAASMPPAWGQDDGATSQQAQAGQANIEKRLRRIEDDIIDMRAMIGALQSFAPGDGTGQTSQGAPSDGFGATDPFAGLQEPQVQSAPSVSGEPSAELRQLEIQVQALSAQLSETVQRLNKLEAALSGSGDPGQSAAATAQPSFGAESGNDATPGASANTGMGFGTTTVETPDAPDDLESAWTEDPLSSDAMAAAQPQAQTLFIQSYEALQAQDYAAAREGFKEFLQSYPNDPLANEARYWLADAAFAQGDLVVAANNLVKAYNTAPTGENSEQTLLKLAIVLRRLDRSESACDALSRLDGQLDGMPESFRQRVSEERRRSGCG